MSESNDLIPSAVIIPKSTSPDSSKVVKRRQSASPEPPTKKTRVSENGNVAPTATRRESPKPHEERRLSIKSESRGESDSLNTAQDRRRDSVQEEKKRGRRLFGGLLNTLSQTAPMGHQKRRQDIEKRQAEKAQQQKIEADLRKAEKLERLKVAQKAEQIKYDEESMRIRHTNLLSMANFLSTKAKPKLYYKPWELLPADAELIESQTQDARSLIDREIEEFYSRYPSRRPDPNSATKTTNSTSLRETAGEPQTESSSDVQTDITNLPTHSPRLEQAISMIETTEDHSGEDIVVAEEDTVIY